MTSPDPARFPPMLVDAALALHDNRLDVAEPSAGGTITPRTLGLRLGAKF